MPSRSRSPLKEINSNAMPIVCILILVGLLVYVLLRWNKSTESFTTQPTVTVKNASKYTITITNSYLVNKKNITNSIKITPESSGIIPICTNNSCGIDITSTKPKSNKIRKTYTEFKNNNFKITITDKDFN